MNFLVDLIKGVFVGIANVIPGVSGGTMAVSFGIYDKLLNAISGLLKSFKKSFFTLLPIILGMAIGIVGFTYIIPWLLANFLCIYRADHRRYSSYLTFPEGRLAK